MWSTLYPVTSSNCSQASHKKHRFFLLTHLRFLRQMLLPNRRPVRNTNRCAKPPTRTQQWKQAIATTVLILACGSYGQAHGQGAKATDSTRYTFDIPALKVEQALSQLAKQTGHQLLFSYAVVGSHKSTAVYGRPQPNQCFATTTANHPSHRPSDRARRHSSHRHQRSKPYG